MKIKFVDVSIGAEFWCEGVKYTKASTNMADGRSGGALFMDDCIVNLYPPQTDDNRVNLLREYVMAREALKVAAREVALGFPELRVGKLFQLMSATIDIDPKEITQAHVDNIMKGLV